MSGAPPPCRSRPRALAFAQRDKGPVAVVDIGSNSVRLVVYESLSRIPATVHNEKAICAIGRDMVTTGRLHAEGCAMALEALARFRMIADGLQVSSREAVATAAARDASNGADFVRRAESRLGCADPRAGGRGGSAHRRGRRAGRNSRRRRPCRRSRRRQPRHGVGEGRQDWRTRYTLAVRAACV